MTPPDLAPLRAWLAAHPSADEAVATWQGGGAGSLPWPSYGAAIEDYWAALDAADWGGIDTRDYPAVTQAWREANGGGAIDAAQLARMDRATLFATLRGVNRAERFGDGAWAAAFARGLFHAGARAVLALPPA